MAERTMIVRAALHLFHIEMGSSPAYWSYDRDQLVTLRNELLEAGIPEREVDGNGKIPEEEEDDDLE